jgi:hypothetical protein
MELAKTIRTNGHAYTGMMPKHKKEKGISFQTLN